MSHRGVAPTGHPAPIRTVIDEALQRDDDLVSFRLFASMKRSTYASTGGPSSGSGDLSCGPTPGRGAIRPLLICRVTGNGLNSLAHKAFRSYRMFEIAGAMWVSRHAADARTRYESNELYITREVMVSAASLNAPKADSSSS